MNTKEKAPKLAKKRNDKKVMRVGRPTKYDPKVIDKIYNYLAICKDDYVVKTFKYKIGKQTKIETKIIYEVRLPSKDDFSTFIGVHRDTLHEWSKKHQNFSDALEQIELEQKKKLLNGGISGSYSPGLAKFILSSNHDMREKKDITSNNQPIMGIDYIVPKDTENEVKN